MTEIENIIKQIQKLSQRLQEERHNVTDDLVNELVFETSNMITSTCEEALKGLTELQQH